jgi:hypothetical protein
MPGTSRGDVAHSYPSSQVLKELHEGENSMKVLLATDGSKFSEAELGR